MNPNIKIKIAQELPEDRSSWIAKIKDVKEEYHSLVKWDLYNRFDGADSIYLWKGSLEGEDNPLTKDFVPGETQEIYANNLFFSQIPLYAITFYSGEGSVSFALVSFESIKVTSWMHYFGNKIIGYEPEMVVDGRIHLMDVFYHESKADVEEMEKQRAEYEAAIEEVRDRLDSQDLEVFDKKITIDSAISPKDDAMRAGNNIMISADPEFDEQGRVSRIVAVDNEIVVDIIYENSLPNAEIADFNIIKGDMPSYPKHISVEIDNTKSKASTPLLMVLVKGFDSELTFARVTQEYEVVVDQFGEKVINLNSTEQHFSRKQLKDIFYFKAFWHAAKLVENGALADYVYGLYQNIIDDGKKWVSGYGVDNVSFYTRNNRLKEIDKTLATYLKKQPKTDSPYLIADMASSTGITSVNFAEELLASNVDAIVESSDVVVNLHLVRNEGNLGIFDSNGRILQVKIGSNIYEMKEIGELEEVLSLKKEYDDGNYVTFDRSDPTLQAFQRKHPDKLTRVVVNVFDTNISEGIYDVVRVFNLDNYFENEFEVDKMKENLKRTLKEGGLLVYGSEEGGELFYWAFQKREGELVQIPTKELGRVNRDISFDEKSNDDDYAMNTEVNMLNRKAQLEKLSEVLSQEKYANKPDIVEHVVEILERYSEEGKKIVIELGAGATGVALALAENNPKVGVIASDIYDNNIFGGYRPIVAGYEDNDLVGLKANLDNLEVVKIDWIDMLKALPNGIADVVLIANPHYPNQFMKQLTSEVGRVLNASGEGL